MTEDTLNGYEQDALWEAIEGAFLDTTMFSRGSADNIERAVASIVAARTAALARDRDALAAKAWDQGFIAARGHLSDYRPNPYRAALAGPEDTARDTQRDNEGSGL